MPRALFDAHLDLAWSAVGFNRDLTRDISDMRSAEVEMTDEPRAGGKHRQLSRTSPRRRARVRRDASRAQRSRAAKKSTHSQAD